MVGGRAASVGCQAPPRDEAFSREGTRTRGTWGSALGRAASPIAYISSDGIDSTLVSVEGLIQQEDLHRVPSISVLALLVPAGVEAIAEVPQAAMITE